MKEYSRSTLEEDDLMAQLKHKYPDMASASEQAAAEQAAVVALGKASDDVPEVGDDEL